MKKNNFGFSLIEIMITILFFAIGITAIFNVVISSMNVNDMNRNSIIASNLAREGLELVINLRDNNYAHLRKWDSGEDGSLEKIDRCEDCSTKPSNRKNKFYIVYNPIFKDNKVEYFTNSCSPYDDTYAYDLWVKENSNLYSEIGVKSKQFLCYSGTLHQYIRGDCEGQRKFLRVIGFEKKYVGTGDKQKEYYIVTSKVIRYSRRYQEVSVSTILADYNYNY